MRVMEQGIGKRALPKLTCKGSHRTMNIHFMAYKTVSLHTWETIDTMRPIALDKRNH